MRRVVITGMGALTPIGNNIGEYLQGLQNGVSGADMITRFDTEHFKTKFACEVKNFNAQDFMHRKEVRRNDLYSIFAQVAADEAIADSGISAENSNQDKIGVIVGSGIGGLATLEKELMDYAKGNGMPRFNPFMIPKMISDIAAGMISMKYGFRGVNYATVSACATSSHAIMAAFDNIRIGRSDAVVTGGSEATILAAGIGGFNAMKALSTRNDDPKTASRPFDLERDGFVQGEGAGILVLEELDHALTRGAKIYAEVMGCGATADAHHMTAPHPEGLGARNVMLEALGDAKMNIEDIDYVNVHGTSTPLGDIAEIKAIQQVFGDKAYDLNISSTKSMTGHLLGAAGAIETIASVLAIKHNFIPPTINHFTDDPAIDSKLNLTFNEAQEKPVNAVISNTFGFGGHNASVIVKRFEK